MGNELEELKKWGAHPSEAIARLLGDYTLYRQLIRDFCENNDVDLLHFRLEQKDYAAAFRVAHTMKGAAASLGLTPLTDALEKTTRKYFDQLDINADLSNKIGKLGAESAVNKVRADKLEAELDDIKEDLQILQRRCFHRGQQDILEQEP